MQRHEKVEVLSDILPDVVAHLQVGKQKSVASNAIRLVDSNNGNLFLWCEASKYLYSTPLLTSSLRSASFQTLVTSISPLFEITTLKCSASGQYALLFGPNGIGVIELPRKWGNDGQFEGGKSTCHCRFTILDESFFSHHISTKIIDVSWYPGSPNDTHLVAVTSDNCLRFYDTTMPEQPMMRLPLFDHSSETVNSISSFASVTGDLVVGFDIALPLVDEMGISTYPIYVMQESGDMWVLYCKFSQCRLVVEMQGPLTMNPPAQDNYGCSYCSITCLPTTPTTVIMATQAGIVHHCLVLLNEEDEDYGDFSVNDVAQKEALYVYESIQLELNWINSNEDGEDYEELPIKLKNIKLLSSGDGGYIGVSEGGVHNVSLPWIEDLSKFLLPELRSGTADQVTPEINTPAEIAYLLCTHPSEESPAVSVCGCTLVEEFTGDKSILALLSTGELLHLKQNSSLRSIKSEFDNSHTERDNQYTSPLRKLHGYGGFDTYIAKILAKNATVPVIRCGGGENEMIPADRYLKLLTKTTQVLHEEYLQKMIQAKLELQKRCRILRCKKEEQNKEILLLQNNSNVMEKGDELAVKFETAQENMQSLYERVEAVLRIMHKSAPTLSKEEEEWGKELNGIQDKLINLRRLSEVVKKKNENSILQTVPERNTSLSKSSMLTATQAVKFRAHLKDQELSISSLVEEIQNLKLKVGSR